MITKGSFVHLNSGSPVLHVFDIGSNDIPKSYEVYVEWINDAGEADQMNACVQCFHLSSELLPIYIGQ